jgi:hypothetical protein
MNSLDIFSVRALMQALEQIHSTMDLEDLPAKLFSVVPFNAVFEHLKLKNRPQLELLSSRAPLRRLHEPDNFSTFVSSPRIRQKCV